MKHDTEANWNTAGSKGFVPRNGEIIIYDKDANHLCQRIKIGDGVNTVNVLSFIDEGLWDQIQTMNAFGVVSDTNGDVVMGFSTLSSVDEVSY